MSTACHSKGGGEKPSIRLVCSGMMVVVVVVMLEEVSPSPERAGREKTRHTSPHLCATLTIITRGV